MYNNLLLIAVLLTLYSCSTKKDVLLFQEKSKLNTTINFQSPKIQSNDILSIQVSTLQPELSAPYNLIQQNIGVAIQLETLKLQGYLVSPEGKINFPIIGFIMVAGKTTQELEELLKPPVCIKAYNDDKP